LVGRHRAGVVPGYGCLGLGEAEGQGLTLILFPFGGSRSRVGPAAAFVRLAFASRTTTDYAQFLTTCVRGLESRRGLGRRRAVRGVYQLVPSPTRAARTVQGILDGHADLGIRDHRCASHGFIRPGLRMTGPAAVDYILARRPVLV
jgi:hypothetical protein